LYPISDAALLYALRELSRRAGVSFEFFKQWNIARTEEGILLQPEASRPGTIVFPVTRREGRLRKFVARKGWGEFGSPRLRREVPDLIVPFCDGESLEREGLFVASGPELFRCTEDLLSSLLLTLCRAEERGARLTDLHGRFPASAGIAAKHGFLRRPIVDEYGLAFREVLQAIVPGWEPAAKSLRVKLSQDIDEIGIQFSFRSAVGHVLLRRSLTCCARDFLSVASDVDPGYLHAVRRICQLALERGVRPTLYWQSAGTDPFDTGYGIRDAKVARIMAWAKEQGVEQGVHPGYKTFRSRELLQEEVQRVQAALGKTEVGGRQHYLRWNAETWMDWESCGLGYDSSAGFVDQAGFRCGTCVPYLPWLLEADRSANLLEIPLVASDGTLVNHMGLGREQSEEVVRELIEKCSQTGGVFTLLWHNTGLFPPCRDYYLPLLEMLRGAQEYDWESELWQLRREREALEVRAAFLRKERAFVSRM
jgi:hypothetical protein